MITRRKFLIASSAAMVAGNGRLMAQQAPMGAMLTKPIPSTGEQLPVIGLGTLEAFDVENSAAEREALAEVLKLLVESGGTLVDTSPRYGNAESVLGDLFTELGIADDLFIATKVFTMGEQEGRDEMNASFDLLNVDEIDLLQVHSMRDWQLHLPSIRQLREDGKVRYVGITIHRDPGHAEMMTIMREENIDFIQVNYNLLARGAADEVLPLAQELGVAVMVNVPFAKAELFSKTSGVDLPGWAADFDCTSWAQFFLKYVVSHPAVTCVIPRTGNPEHMRDNLMAGFGRMPDMDARLEMERFIDALA